MKIIIFLLVVHFLFFITENSFAVNSARVHVDKAFVFSDTTFSKPIGYFRRGEMVPITSDYKDNGKIIKSTYQGKVVFIRKSDLFISEDDPFEKSDSKRDGFMSMEEVDNSKTIKELIKESAVTADYRMITLGDSMLYYYNYTNTRSGNFVNITLDYWWSDSFATNFGFYDFFVADKNMQYMALGPSIGAIYKFLNFYPIDLNVSSSIFYSPYTTADVGEYRFEGSSYGFDVGGFMNFKLTPSWKLKLGGGYFYHNSQKLKHSVSIDGGKYDLTLPSLKTTGTYLSLGTTFVF